MKAVEKRMDNVFRSIHYTKKRQLSILLDELKTAREALREWDKETTIATEIKRTTLKSYCRHGDKNHLSPAVILHYIRKRGIPLDVQAMDLTEQYGVPFTEQDFIDFMFEHPNGPSNFYKFQELKTVQEAIKEITGFNASIKFIQYLKRKLNSVPSNKSKIKTPF